MVGLLGRAVTASSHPAGAESAEQAKIPATRSWEPASRTSADSGQGLRFGSHLRPGAGRTPRAAHSRRSAQRNVAASVVTDVMTLSRRGDSMANAHRRRPKYIWFTRRYSSSRKASSRWTETAESSLRGCISQQRERRRKFHLESYECLVVSGINSAPLESGAGTEA